MTELLLEITNLEMQSIAKQVYQYEKGNSSRIFFVNFSIEISKSESISKSALYQNCSIIKVQLKKSSEGIFA